MSADTRAAKSSRRGRRPEDSSQTQLICESQHYVNTGSASLAIMVAEAFSTSA